MLSTTVRQSFLVPAQSSFELLCNNPTVHSVFKLNPTLPAAASLPEEDYEVLDMTRVLGGVGLRS